MNRFKILVLLACFSVLFSCGSKKIAGTSPADDAALANVITEHYKKEADFETMQGRLRVHFQNKSTDQALTVSFRIKKDDTIWMSGKILGFPLAKVLITPNSVQYYEKFNQTYFDGDFSLLSNLLGTPLDFEKVQNLLIGQAVYDLKKGQYTLTDSSRGYELTPIAQNFLQKKFLLDAGTYKILAQQISQEAKNRNVIITYPEYQKIDGRVFPKKIEIIANEGTSNSLINMEFRSVEFNVPISFPFSIPSGYEEITIE